MAQHRENDFRLTIDRAAGLLTDATCSARAAIARPVPPPHRRWVEGAIADLERAQMKLFKAQNDPWSPPPQPRHPQLALL